MPLSDRSPTSCTQQGVGNSIYVSAINYRTQARSWYLLFLLVCFQEGLTEEFAHHQMTNELTGLDAIPKFIHQAWIGKELPSWDHSSSWRILNRDFKWILWGRKEIVAFLEKNFPKHFSLLDEISMVELTDIFRYAILYHVGGIYADIDAECLVPVAEWEQKWPEMKKSHGAILGQSHGKNVYNFVLVFAPAHPIMRDTLEQILLNINRSRSDAQSLNEIRDYQSRVTEFILRTLKKTGPVVFSSIVYQYKSSHQGNETLILPHGGAFISKTKSLSNRTLVRHHHIGSWKYLNFTENHERV